MEGRGLFCGIGVEHVLVEVGQEMFWQVVSVVEVPERLVSKNG